MSTTIVLSGPKSFPLRSSILGVPLAIWALLLIAVASYLRPAVITFGPLELLPPF
jgi:hypothetical protein